MRPEEIKRYEGDEKELHYEIAARIMTEHSRMGNITRLAAALTDIAINYSKKKNQTPVQEAKDLLKEILKDLEFDENYLMKIRYEDKIKNYLNKNP